MIRNRLSVMCLSGIVVGMGCAFAEAHLPADRTIVYKIREIPSDPNSVVIFTIALDLVADDLDGESVGWKINEIRFQRISDGKKWIEDFGGPGHLAPNLWWIDHADHDVPQLGEFADPPHLIGRADAVTVTDPDLDYDFVGGVCDANCQAMFNGNVGALTAELWMVDEPAPEVDDEDEPVEVDDGR